MGWGEFLIERREGKHCQGREVGREGSVNMREEVRGREMSGGHKEEKN